MQQNTTSALELINLTLIMFWSFAVIFGVCEFGEKLSEAFGGIAYVYDQFTWYLFPYVIQHGLSTLIIFAQKPIELRVFGNISCGRITFKNVWKFQVIQQISHKLPWFRIIFWHLTIFWLLCRYATKLIHTSWFFGVLEIEILRKNKLTEINSSNTDKH